MSKAAELANLIGNINAGGGGVNRNIIINGAMNVAQRSTSETGKGDADGYFTLDRFAINTGASSAGRFTMSQDSSAPSGFANSLKLDCTTADTSIASGEILQLIQKIEGQNLQAFAKGTSDAKPFAVSFYVKGNASATYVCELFDSDNSRQVSKTFNVTTDWTRVELTFPADTTGAFDDDNGASLELAIILHGGSDFTSGTLNSSGFASNTNANRAVGISSFFDSTDRTFFITGVQLEVGQNPTEFEHEPFDVTLRKCHRYFEKQIYQGGSYVHVGYFYTTSGCRSVLKYKRKRAVPSFTFNNQGNVIIYHSGNNDDVPSLSYHDHSTDYARITIGLSGETTTAGYAGAVYNDAASGTTYDIKIDAEL